VQRGGRARPERERTEEEGGTEGRRGREDGREEGEGGMVESRRSTRPRGGATRRRTHRIWKEETGMTKERKGGGGEGEGGEGGRRRGRRNATRRRLNLFFGEGVSVIVETIIGTRCLEARVRPSPLIQPAASCVASRTRLVPLSPTNAFRRPYSTSLACTVYCFRTWSRFAPSPSPPYASCVASCARLAPLSPTNRWALLLWLALALFFHPRAPAFLRPLRTPAAFAPREARRAPALGRGGRAPALDRGHPRRAEAEELLSPWLALALFFHPRAPAFLRPLRTPATFASREARRAPALGRGGRAPALGRGHPRQAEGFAGGWRRGAATQLQRNST